MTNNYKYFWGNGGFTGENDFEMYLYVNEILI